MSDPRTQSGVRALYGVVLVVMAALSVQVGFVGTASAGNCTEISGAANIETSGCYTVTDGVHDSDRDYVIQVRASDVIIDGQDHTLDGNSNDSTGQAAIRVDGDDGNRRSNVTIENFSTIADFNHTVKFEYTSGSTVKNLTTATAPKSGIRMDYSHNNEIRNVHAKLNGYDGGAGVYLHYSDQNTLAESNISANKDDGVVLSYSQGTTINETNASDNTHEGLYNRFSDNTEVNDSELNYNTEGVQIHGGSDNISITNTVTKENELGVNISRSAETAPRDIRLVDHGSFDNTAWDFRHDPLRNTPQNITFASDSDDDTLRPHNVRFGDESSPPSDPSGYDNVSSYLDVEQVSQTYDTYFNATVTYSDDDVSDVDESTLGLWRHDGSDWSEVSSASADTDANEIIANLTTYGTLAFLAESTSSGGGGGTEEETTTRAPSISVGTDSLAFENVTVDDETAESVTVANDGDAVLDVSDVSVAGFDPDPFAATPTSFELAPGESERLNVTFEPPAREEYSARLDIDSNDSDNRTSQVGLAGRGVAGELAVDTDAVAFGSAFVSTVTTRSVALTNDGDGPLTVTNVSLGGNDPGQFRTTNDSLTLDPGASKTVDVEFAPQGATDASATLTVETDAPSDSTAAIDLSGSGIRPSIAATPRHHDYGTVRVGNTSDVSVTVENQEEGIVEVYGARIAGPDAGSFRVTEGDAAVTLNGTATHDISVAFAPETAGNKTARLELLNGSDAPMYAVALNGTAVAPAVEVNTRSLSFTDATVNETSTRNVTVENRGGATLTVESQQIKPGDGPFEIKSPVAETIGAGENDTVTVAFKPTSPNTTSATLSLVTDDPDTGTVPLFLSSSDVAANISISETENRTNLNATIENAKAGEEVSINVPDDAGKPAGVDSISVTPDTDGTFSVDVTESADPLESSPAFEKETDPENVGYMSIDHSIDNENIPEASVSYRVSEERMAAMESEPDDVALYRHTGEGGWTATDTAFVRETDDGDYLFKSTTTGFSEWTAAAEVPRINVTDATANVSVLTTQETVEIDVLLNNTGGSDGRFETRLLLNGSVVERRTVAVAPSSTSLVTFLRNFDQPGTYQVEVNRQFVAAIDVSPSEGEAEVTGGETAVPVQADGGDTERGGGAASGGSDGTDGTEGTSGGIGPLSPVLTVVALLVGGWIATRKGGG